MVLTSTKQLQLIGFALACACSSIPSTDAFSFSNLNGPKRRTMGFSALQSSSTSSSSTASSSTDTDATRISIEPPEIHYTVPGFKIGWQDENGKWFDEDGPREGPPQNYWRQSMDEREYKSDMEVLDAVQKDFGVSEKINNLEKVCSARYPSLNRKILGTWAPLLRCGKKVIFDDKPRDDESGVEVPMTVDVFRTAGRKFAARIHYGLFDASLKDGEEITVRTSDGSIDVTFAASEENEPEELGLCGDGFPLHLGDITYISDYLLIQRGPEGDVDLWLRCDDSYLGRNKEEDAAEANSVEK